MHRSIILEYFVDIQIIIHMKVAVRLSDVLHVFEEPSGGKERTRLSTVPKITLQLLGVAIPGSIKFCVTPLRNHCGPLPCLWIKLIPYFSGFESSDV